LLLLFFCFSFCSSLLTNCQPPPHSLLSHCSLYPTGHVHLQSIGGSQKTTKSTQDPTN
jgi:hypothetical protein